MDRPQMCGIPKPCCENRKVYATLLAIYDFILKEMIAMSNGNDPEKLLVKAKTSTMTMTSANEFV